MSYSHTEYDPDAPDRFPPPQLWLCWVEGIDFTYKQVDYTYNDINGNPVSGTRQERDKVIWTGVGKVRHKNDLADARKYCGTHYVRKDGYWGQVEGMEPGTWWSDWKIFEWVDGEWVLRYEGFKGQKKKDHELYTRDMGRKLRAEAGPSAQEAYALSVVQSSMKAVS